MKPLRLLGSAGIVAATVLALAGPASAQPASTQTAPGTPSRPILSAAEAAPFVPSNYSDRSGPYTAPVADPWHPRGIALPRHRPDFVVAPATTGQVGQSATAGQAGPGSQPATGRHPVYTGLQAAVNRAFVEGGTARRYIMVLPGTYTGTVFIPAGGPPLTIYGAGRASDVRIQFTVDATITPAAWAALVNPSGQYAPGDPAWPMFNSCATSTSATAGLCATVVWSQSPDLQLRGLTIVNTLLDTVDKGTHQALALRTDADRIQLQDMRLIGRQDTFYANAGDPASIARVWVRDSYVEGDTDFVFGRASAVFEHTEFHLVSSRKPSGGVIFAPNTAPAYPYGFLVVGCRITADAGYLANPTGHLGRAWDQGASKTGYIPGSTPNGQLVIRDSYLGPGFDTLVPWAPAATTSRPFLARVDPGRDLNDPNYNRLWEYRNVGQGAATPAG